MSITLGAGKDRPQGRIFHLDKALSVVESLEKALEDIEPGPETWWSLHRWERDYRKSDGWLSSLGVGIDLDYHNEKGKHKGSIPPEDRKHLLEGVVENEVLPGNLFHHTPHGARVIFLFPAPVADRELWQRAAQGACTLVSECIERLGISATRKQIPEKGRMVWCDGYHVDNEASCDLARLFYTPNAIVDGAERSARLVVMSTAPVTPEDLARYAPSQTTQEKNTSRQNVKSNPEGKESSDFAQAAAKWNEDHLQDWATHNRQCPSCGHKDCFGPMPKDSTFWYCFSSNHGDECGQRGAKGFWGDALDIEAYSRKMTRQQVLLADGYLSRKSSKQSQEEEKESFLTEAQNILDTLTGKIKDKPEESRSAIATILKDSEALATLAHLKVTSQGDFSAALLSLREAGTTARDTVELEKAVNAELRTIKRRQKFHAVQPGEDVELLAVREALPDAPVPENVVVPAGWELSPEGLSRCMVNENNEAERQIVIPSPVVIEGRLVDVAEGTESTRLAWQRDGKWQQHTTDRATIANTRTIVALAGVGLPVTSLSAGHLVKFLGDFEAQNLTTIPRAHVSRQMGWQGKGGKIKFLWGRTLLCADTDEMAAIDVNDFPPENWREDWISFRGADSGDDQLVDGFRAEGSLEKSIHAARLALPYKRVIVGFYASLVPPLLSIVDAPNFVMNWSYTTSTGKSTTLYLAASVWGNPDERKFDSVLWTWDCTRVWVERASAILNSLPLILDDTKRAKNPKIIGQTIYDVCSGKGKGRGSPKGMRRAGSWTTIMLCSGEARATSFTEDGGTRTRVLELWGPPFGTANETTAKVVHELNLAVRQNYGHIGPRFVQFILKNHDQWREWQTEYHAIERRYQQKAGADPFANRLCSYFAILDLTAGLFNIAFGNPWPYEDPIAALWDDLVKEASEADRARAALGFLMSWADGHQEDFWGRHTHIGNKECGVYPKQPHAGWAGAWEIGDDWEYIGFLPHRLRAILKDADFDPDAIIRLWADREWLRKDKDGNPRVVLRVNGVSEKVYAIKREAFTE